MSEKDKNANENKVRPNTGVQLKYIVNDDNDHSILDAYYANGFNRLLAVESVRGDHGSRSILKRNGLDSRP